MNGLSCFAANFKHIMSSSSKETLSSEVLVAMKGLLPQATATYGGGSSAKSVEKGREDSTQSTKTHDLGDTQPKQPTKKRDMEEKCDESTMTKRMRVEDGSRRDESAKRKKREREEVNTNSSASLPSIPKKSRDMESVSSTDSSRSSKKASEKDSQAFMAKKVGEVDVKSGDKPSKSPPTNPRYISGESSTQPKPPSTKPRDINVGSSTQSKPRDQSSTKPDEKSSSKSRDISGDSSTQPKPPSTTKETPKELASKAGTQKRTPTSQTKRYNNPLRTFTSLKRGAKPREFFKRLFGVYARSNSTEEQLSKLTDCLSSKESMQTLFETSPLFKGLGVCIEEVCGVVESFMNFHGADKDKWMEEWKAHRCSLLRLGRFAKRVTITMKELDFVIKGYKKTLKLSKSNTMMDNNNDDDDDEQSEVDDDRRDDSDKGRGRAPTKCIVCTRVPSPPSRHHDNDTKTSRAQSIGHIRIYSPSPTRKSRDMMMHDDHLRRPRAHSVGRKQSPPSRDYHDDRDYSSYGNRNQMMDTMQSGALFPPFSQQQDLTTMLLNVQQLRLMARLERQINEPKSSGTPDYGREDDNTRGRSRTRNNISPPRRDYDHHYEHESRSNRSPPRSARVSKISTVDKHVKLDYRDDDYASDSQEQEQ
jgi:hypothetical protein